MKKKILFILFGAMMSLFATADGFVTSGDGTTWTIRKLLEEGSSVGVTTNGDVVMINDITIAEADSFAIEPGDDLCMVDNVRLTILGGCSLDAGDEGAVFRAWGTMPYGLWIEGKNRVKMHNVTFRGAGVSAHVVDGMVQHGFGFLLRLTRPDDPGDSHQSNVERRCPAEYDDTPFHSKLPNF